MTPGNYESQAAHMLVVEKQNKMSATCSSNLPQKQYKTENIFEDMQK